MKKIIKLIISLTILIFSINLTNFSHAKNYMYATLTSTVDYGPFKVLTIRLSNNSSHESTVEEVKIYTSTEEYIIYTSHNVLADDENNMLVFLWSSQSVESITVFSNNSYYGYYQYEVTLDDNVTIYGSLIVLPVLIIIGISSGFLVKYVKKRIKINKDTSLEESIQIKNNTNDKKSSRKKKKR